MVIRSILGTVCFSRSNWKKILPRLKKWCQALGENAVSISTVKKWPYTGKGPRPVILLHDNSRPHTAKTTSDALNSLGWKVLPHPDYSPDLAPSDFYLFRSLQNYLVDSHFKTFEEIEKCITDFIDSKPPWFYRQGIRHLPERWKKCIEVNGDYFLD